MRKNKNFLCTLYMKFGKYIMKNKTYVIIFLVSLLILHSSGLLDNLLGLREKILIEGAKGKKKSEKELRVEERNKNLKQLKKAVKSVEKEVKRLKAMRDVMGITSEERDLTLQVIDYQIKYFESTVGFLLFRSNKPGNFVMNTPTKIFFTAYNTAFGDYTNEKRKINHNDDGQIVGIYINMIDKMKRMRKLVANMEVVD